MIDTGWTQWASGDTAPAQKLPSHLGREIVAQVEEGDPEQAAMCPQICLWRALVPSVARCLHCVEKEGLQAGLDGRTLGRSGSTKGANGIPGGERKEETDWNRDPEPRDSRH